MKKEPVKMVLYFVPVPCGFGFISFLFFIVPYGKNAP